ncbi:MAG: hypothetical protein ACYCPT_08310 [Acidimicrobiales bacterium]
MNMGTAMMRFHLDPSFEKFKSIYAHIMSNNLGDRACINYWTYGVIAKHPEYPKFIDSANTATAENVYTLMTKEFHSPKNLDELWSLYFGSGDARYKDIIRNIAQRNIPADEVTVMAASWSYASICDQEN